MPGRLRTGSRPSRTWMSPASYVCFAKPSHPSSAPRVPSCVLAGVGAASHMVLLRSPPRTVREASSEAPAGFHARTPSEPFAGLPAHGHTCHASIAGKVGDRPICRCGKPWPRRLYGTTEAFYRPKNSTLSAHRILLCADESGLHRADDLLAQFGGQVEPLHRCQGPLLLRGEERCQEWSRRQLAG